ncbi:hypothetical protein LCGC14_1957570 [marine sediment metagenome]|uniref:Uncharacterized protein n=1 Tax=marine sediment metagenome TaxID=412755 RepID=A0A0F9G3V3_9ZZZZ
MVSKKKKDNFTFLVPDDRPIKTKVARKVFANTKCDWYLIPKSKLEKYSKKELIDELHRVYTNMKLIAQELGIAPRDSGVKRFSLHFCALIETILKASWNCNYE